MFAHSRSDSLLVLLCGIQISLLIWVAFAFSSLPWPALVCVGGVLIFLTCTNYQCVAHNFIHNPFFHSKVANQWFAVMNSLALGMPQNLYYYHHMNHHKYNNDDKDLQSRETEDRSSIFRFSSKRGKAENIIPYALLGVLRAELAPLYQEAKRGRRDRQIQLETIVLIGFASVLVFWNYKFAIFFYLPVWYLAQVAAFAENYLRHYGANPGNRLTDSVSSYGKFYNWIWFNNGYHQEHHYRPGVHWTEIPAIREMMLPDTERRVARGAHWFNVRRPRV